MINLKHLSYMYYLFLYGYLSHLYIQLKKNESKKAEKIKKSVDSDGYLKDMSIEIMKQQNNTMGILKKRADRLEAEIKELRSLKEVNYTNLSTDEVVELAFNPGLLQFCQWTPLIKCLINLE